jgi:hypothetical protein
MHPGSFLPRAQIQAANIIVKDMKPTAADRKTEVKLLRKVQCKYLMTRLLREKLSGFAP